ncbi:MAG: hypothetical protein LLG00_12435 [Planctomycetaceae bacterium]|nr:hypothetical protein [Planctomycetaceae bacterium]
MDEIQAKTEEPMPAVEAAPAAARPPVSRAFVWAVCGILFAAFLGVDYATPQVFDTELAESFFAVCLGLCISQINLIAVWAALAPGNIVLRLSWSSLLTLMMWYTLLAGSMGTTGQFPLVSNLCDALVLGGILLAGVLILQVPLWAAKKWFRWRLSRGAEDAGQFALEDRQFNLQHLLLAILLWAIALSPLRAVLPPGPAVPFHVDGGLLVLTVAMILSNVLITIPCIWWAFQPAARLWGLTVGWLFYAVVLTVVEVAILSAISGTPANRIGEVIGTFLIVNVTQCLTVFGVLRIFRAMGYRMVRFAPAKR